MHQSSGFRAAVISTILGWVLFLPGIADSAPQTKLSWAGCGISKNAFMQEMADAFEKKYGVKIELVGGGATK